MAVDALITYGCNRVSYSALRSLCALGLKVAVADKETTGMCQWSRYSSGSYRYHDPLKETGRFVEDIRRILKASGAGFLLPVMNDTEVLARHRGALPADVVLPLGPYESIRAANDKAGMAALAVELGVPVPETLRWGSWDELGEKLAGLGGGAVVKLRTGHSSKGVYYPQDPAAAVAKCRELAERYRLGPDAMPMVQRKVEGEPWVAAFLYHHGRRLASFTYRRLREKISTGGTSTLRVSAPNAAVEEHGGRMLDALGWHGVAMVEFKVEPDTARAWFMEINPRLWGSLNLAAAAGVDFVGMLYTASIHGPDRAAELARPQKNGVVCRWWLGDAITAASEAKRLRIGNALRLVMPGGAGVYDDFRADDPGATVGQVAGCLSRVLRKGRLNSELGKSEVAA